jgi:hypothetical protein
MPAPILRSGLPIFAFGKCLDAKAGQQRCSEKAAFTDKRDLRRCLNRLAAGALQRYRQACHAKTSHGIRFVLVATLAKLLEKRVGGRTRARTRDPLIKSPL